MKKLFVVIMLGAAFLLANFSKTNAGTIYASQDGLVNEMYPKYNYSTGISIGIKSQSGSLQRSYLRFDLSGISDNSVITSATLHLYCYSNGSSGLSVGVYRTGNFSEGTLTWTNQPGLDPSYALTSETLAPEWNSWNIVQQWNYKPDLGANNLALSVRFKNEAGSGQYAYFWSREYAGLTYDPYLVIEYTPVPIPAAAWLLGSGLIGLVAFGGRRRRY
ncbi:MAG TPA: VPLPA-CTERM sorting domain-containing protein [Deltaproteobacteria bacterium]|nr:VPLPA-CTERM sorting domain-containing protein [Deltaproteobacteria bacterium]